MKLRWKIYVLFFSLLLLEQSSFGQLGTSETLAYEKEFSFDATQIFLLNGVSKKGGIIGNVNNGGEIKLTVYAYDVTNHTTHKGALIYGVSAKNSSEDLAGEPWTTPGLHQANATVSTDNMKQLMQNARSLGTTCNWFQTYLSGFLSKGIFAIQPCINTPPIDKVIIDIYIKNAILKAIKVPGMRQIDANEFEFPQSIVEIKGSNFEKNPIEERRSYGHINNRFTIDNINRSYEQILENLNLTGLYDDNSSDPRSYFKVKIPTLGALFFALKRDKALPSDFQNSTVLYQNAFKITNGAESRTFDIYKFSAQPGSQIKFEASKDGPFIVARDFDVSFKANPALALNLKNKLYNRKDHNNEVLICAHRGIWSKVGSHYDQNESPNPDFSGIAENTITSFKEALTGPLNKYVDWIEFDARRTKDGVFVSWHDEHVRRVSDFADKRDCIPLEDINRRTKPGYDMLAGNNLDSRWLLSNSLVGNLNWHMTTVSPNGTDTYEAFKDLHVRDYLGCKVKNTDGTFAKPITLNESFDWLLGQRSEGRHSIISVDYKDKINHLDELYKLILEKDLEGEIILSVYANDASLTDYQTEYGKDFLKQIPFTPTFYEPASDKAFKYAAGGPQNHGERLKNAFIEYLDAGKNGHFIPGVIYNPNYDGDTHLIAFSKTADFRTRMGLDENGNPISNSEYNPKWYMTHYHEPFLSSMVDNNKIATPLDSDPNAPAGTELKVDKFWRADFDWIINNGATALFSDGVESLVEYLIAKEKKIRELN